MRKRFNSLDFSENDLVINTPKKDPDDLDFSIVVKSVGAESALFGKAASARGFYSIVVYGKDGKGRFRRINLTLERSAAEFLVGYIFLKEEDFKARNYEVLFVEFFGLMSKLEGARDFVAGIAPAPKILESEESPTGGNRHLFDVIRLLAELPDCRCESTEGRDLDTKPNSRTLRISGLPVAVDAIKAGTSGVAQMEKSIKKLEGLLNEQCADESSYQALLKSAPWMLGGIYEALIRHQKMDDEQIPDFTAMRVHDQCHDIIELKQPFLKLFRSDETFSAAFSDAWHQAERYLDFCMRQRNYLLDQKHLRFDNPKCILLMGSNFTMAQSDAIRAKESMSRLIKVMSYDQLLVSARHVHKLVSEFSDPGL